jgi:protein kinase C substrate 80K-H
MKFVIILLTISAALGSHTTVLRGVQEKRLDHYSESSDLFTCLDGSRQFPWSFVNDEYCDCADGSDEPGTSACSFRRREPDEWKFQCSDQQFGTKEILHGRINDRICDCCDGSDEYDSGIQCPNTCAAAFEKQEKERKTRELARIAGVEKKTEMVAAAVQRRQQLKSQLEEELNGISKSEFEVEEARHVMEAAEERERAEREAIKQRSQAEYDVWKVKIEQAEAMRKHAEDLQPTSSDKVLCVKWRQTKDCVGSGEFQSDADKDCEMTIEDGWSGQCECVDTDTGDMSYYPFDCGHKKLTCAYVCSHSGQEPAVSIDEETPSFTVNDGSSFTLPEAEAARNEHREKRKALDDKQQRAKDLEADIARDFGPDDAMLLLFGQCFELDQREYTYKLCPFKEVHQLRRGAGHGPLIGRWKGFGEQSYSVWGSKQDYSHMLFDQGERCWGGPDRSANVHVVCGGENKLLSVDEPSMCAYKMVFQTPAVCE